MKGRFVRISLCLAITSFSVYAQVDINRFQNIMQTVSGGGGGYSAGFKGTFNAAGVVKGDPYLDTAFQQTNFTFNKSDTRVKTPARYDIFNDEFEIMTTGGIRVLKAHLIKGFATYKGQDSLVYTNAAVYKLEGAPLTGYVNVLSTGKLELLRVTRLEIVKPSYNASLEVGDRNSHIIKKEVFYYGINNDLFKMKGKKKDILKLFEAEQAKVDNFATQQNLDFRKTEDLKLIFDYYNQQARK